MGKCAQLIPIGLDLSFEVNRLAAPSLKSALQTNFENILESIKLRNSVGNAQFLKLNNL
jgi:hypothetical protein